ncbi:NAD(P)-binding protein [Athelia psychrophila]|uniref:NAD(P)-binding protein n=1 Tax=Athelia psychrophila TaxID=1759441 RepID=A0A166VYR1_9AGAM|nr:NAD(P)-binding protein [Fibularhizoctonia sp. CBS 109695]
MSTPPTTILITGANQGLGFETARQLSKHPNVHLFLAGRDLAKIQEAQTKITTEEGCQASVDTVIIDITDDSSIEAGVQEVQSKLREAALDVLVNNAGVYIGDQTPDKGLRRVFEETYAVNVFGAAVVADSFLPLLKQSKSEGGGRIINLSSGLGSIATMADPDGQYKGGWLYAYNSSKSALNSITVTLAMKNPELHVVCIDPGYNATSMNNYSGPMDPKDGVKVMVAHALKKVGKSAGYYSNDGEPGYNATSMNNYSGPMDPKDGVKVMVAHALKKVGKSAGYYSNDGEVLW